jgi:hypothetical protein
VIPAPPPPDRSNPNLAAALTAAAASISPERIDQVWIFPPHARGTRESGLAVLAVFAGHADDARRTIYTVGYEALAIKTGIQRSDSILEEGTVPRDRLDRLVDGIVRRLGGGLETPEIREVTGDPDAWSFLLAELEGSRGPS